jgi:hypothetical protein
MALTRLALRACPDARALVEVGISAGLLPAVDRYAASPAFSDSDSSLLIAAGPRVPLPPTPTLEARIPRRIGIDLNVPDVNDEADRRWLGALAWGDQPARLARLDPAGEIARVVPLEIHDVV